MSLGGWLCEFFTGLLDFLLQILVFHCLCEFRGMALFFTMFHQPEIDDAEKTNSSQRALSGQGFNNPDPASFFSATYLVVGSW